MNGNEAFTAYFYPSIIARFVRVYPISWKISPVLRLEMYGCTGGMCRFCEVLVEFRSNNYAPINL